ncbi:carbon-nitrogen hydrolase family protein, partial [Candidatus Bathyarchaeota archaeon]|nr:carbon-nitrogen hydrolase family protein [Candidatus Bathyarchaeota archaeon]
MADTLKIALAQISCKRADKTSNIEKMKVYAEKAKKEGAELVIFPELSLTDYLVRDLIYELAEPIPGPSVEKMAEIAKQNKIYIVFGMPEMSEKAESVIYNTAVLVGPEGYIGKYRKMHLPTHSVFEEERYFRQG